MQRAIIILLLIGLLVGSVSPAAAQGDDLDDPNYWLDSDKDGFPDGAEQEAGTDPSNPDTDGDGMRDGVEAFFMMFGAPFDPSKPNAPGPSSLSDFSRQTLPPWPDAPGDVYDYALTQPLSSTAWQQWGKTIDIAGVTTTAGSLNTRGSPVTVPSVAIPTAPQASEPCSSVWRRLYPPGESLEFGPGDRRSFLDTTVFGANDGGSLLEISGLAAGNVTFYEDRIEVEFWAGRSGVVLNVTYRDECTGQTVVRTVQVSAGEKQVISLKGVNATLTYDDAADTLEAVMTEGSFEIEGADQVPLVVPADSDTSLAIQVDGDGNVTNQDIPLAEAIRRFPPLFRSLSFFVWMLQPIPENMDGIDAMAWVAMLDLDGDPTTGLTMETANNRMYSGLGADAYVPVFLQADGTLAGVIVFNDGQADVAGFPVEVELTPNRDGVFIHAPLDVLNEQSAAMGVPFSLDALKWRIATVFHGPDGDAKDVFPEVEDMDG